MLVEQPFPTIIAEATRIQGDVSFHSEAQIFGIVEGKVLQQSLDSVQVGKSGWICGQIVSQGPVVVEGRVDGDIHSQTKVQLMAAATVRGRIRAPKVEVRAGAILEGSTQMEGVTVPMVVPQAA